MIVQGNRKSMVNLTNLFHGVKLFRRLKTEGGLMMNTLEDEILTLLKDVDKLGQACKELEQKIKKLRMDVESQLNVKEGIVDDNLTRRENGRVS